MSEGKGEAGTKHIAVSDNVHVQDDHTVLLSAPKPNFRQRLLGLRRRNLILFGAFVFWGVLAWAAHYKGFYFLETPGLDVTFAEAFWPNFLADFLVGLLLAWFLGDILDRASGYKLQMVLEVPPHARPDKTSQSQRFDVTFHVINNGTEHYKEKEIRWHIFAKEGDLTTPNEVPRVMVSQEKLEGTQYQHYTAPISNPLFPGDRDPSILNISILLKRATSTRIYYYFSTTHGFFPRSVKLDEKGRPRLDSLQSHPIPFDDYGNES